MRAVVVSLAVKTKVSDLYEIFDCRRPNSNSFEANLGVKALCLAHTVRLSFYTSDFEELILFFSFPFLFVNHNMMDKRRHKIGFALAKKKQQSFLQPALVKLAKTRGIDFVPIDSTRSLVEQGPFDAILHKLRGEEWYRQLEEYCQKHPRVFVIDHPEAIERLHNRISMLQAVAELKISEGNETFGVPMQIVVDRPEVLSDSEILCGLRFPVIAKPLVADGSAISHALSLVFNANGLKQLNPPLVLQGFVNHGGVVFKVYVAGKFVECVKRKSLPDISDEKLESSSEGCLPFSQISNMPLDNNASSDEVMELEEIELPPSRVIGELANGLREVLGLRLFNFDVIRDSKVRNRYLVLDINYFPGYAKMPNYEFILTDFLYDLLHENLEVVTEKVALEANASHAVDGETATLQMESAVCNDDTDGVIPFVESEEQTNANGRTTAVVTGEGENEIYC